MYQIITDGSCDLGTEWAEKLGVDVVPFYVSLDGETYQKEIVDVDIRDFYQFMVDHPTVFPKSSLPSVEDYITVFTKYAKQNIPMICICITTKFSGSYNAAMNAKQIVQETYPDVPITVIDSTVDTVLQGIFVMELARHQQAGATYDDILAMIERIAPTGRIFFTVGNIDYLAKGGRIGKLAKLATGALKIKPLIILKEGEIFPAGITRGREKSKKKVVNMVLNYIRDNGNNPDDFAITVGYGYDREEGQKFRDDFIAIIKAEWPNAEAVVEILQIGATIGVHTGPYPLGFGIIKK